MTSSKHMTWLFDRDLCNGLVRRAWMSAVMVSVLASS